MKEQEDSEMLSFLRDSICEKIDKQTAHMFIVADRLKEFSREIHVIHRPRE